MRKNGLLPALDRQVQYQREDSGVSAGGGVAGDSRTILPSKRRSESMIAERSVLPGRVRVSVRLSDGAAFLCVLQPQQAPAAATAHSMNRNIVFLFICML